MDPLQRTCSIVNSMSESSPRKEKLIEQPVSQGNINEPEPSGAYSIEEDLWRPLKQIQLPVFRGDKRSYQNWKAAFSTGEYKLLQLRQCLSGEALNVI